MRGKLLIMRTYVSLKIRTERLLEDPGADLRSAFGKRADVFRIEAAQALFDAPGQVAEEFAESLGRGGKPARNANPGGGEAAHHFAQRGVLAADLLEVLEAEVFKPRYAHSFGILSL